MRDREDAYEVATHLEVDLEEEPGHERPPKLGGVQDSHERVGRFGDAIERSDDRRDEFLTRIVRAASSAQLQRRFAYRSRSSESRAREGERVFERQVVLGRGASPELLDELGILSDPGGHRDERVGRQR